MTNILIPKVAHFKKEKRKMKEVHRSERDKIMNLCCFFKRIKIK